MKLKITVLFTGILVMIAGLTGCNSPGKAAVGIEDEILVFSDSLDYVAMEETLNQVFGKVIYTPQPENLFNLEWRDITKINHYKTRKNIIIMAPLDSESNGSIYMRGLLDSTVTDMVKSGKEFVFTKFDEWAKNQLVMVLAANTIDDLKEKVGSNQEDLVYYFQKVSDKRLAEKLYSHVYERKEIQAQLLNDYGWMIYVQIDFHLAKNVPEDNFVWLRRAPGSDMERWIFVHWIDNATPEYLNRDSVIALRNRITQKYYRTSDDRNFVEIAQYDEYLKTSEVNFNNRYALMTEGLWRMDDKSMGGPFVNYTFFDEKTNRIYMLDGSLYAPKYYKKKLIQQVDVMLKSFQASYEISDDRKEQLLDELPDKD